MLSITSFGNSIILMVNDCTQNSYIEFSADVDGQIFYDMVAKCNKKLRRTFQTNLGTKCEFTSEMCRKSHQPLQDIKLTCDNGIEETAGILCPW